MFRNLIAAALIIAVPVLTQAEPVGNRVKINGMQMYYEVSGAGEPLVVLHGAFMNIPLMGGIIRRLAESHAVYALELQGHGRTTDIDRPITCPHLAGDVAAFMEAVGISSADVFGFSMGGQTALQLAARHPEKVRKLVAASVVFDREGWDAEFREMIPRLTVDMLLQMPFAMDYPRLAADP